MYILGSSRNWISVHAVNSQKRTTLSRERRPLQSFVQTPLDIYTGTSVVPQMMKVWIWGQHWFPKSRIIDCNMTFNTRIPWISLRLRNSWYFEIHNTILFKVYVTRRQNGTKLTFCSSSSKWCWRLAVCWVIWLSVAHQRPTPRI